MNYQQTNQLLLNLLSLFYNPTDIIKFAWDNEEEMNKETSMSNEDIERLRKKAKEYSLKNK